MTVSETRQFLGDSIEVSYFNGADYVSSSASYYSSGTYDFNEISESPVGFVAGSHLWVQYTLYVPNLILNPDYIQIKVNPTYSIFDTEYIYTAFALSSYGRISMTYNSPQCNWYKGGSVLNFQNTTSEDSTNTYHSYIIPNQWNPLYYSYYFSYIPIVMSSNSTFSAYAMDCNFYGNESGGGNDSYKYTFWVMCPYVSGNAIGASGTFTTADGQGSINIDLSDTNNLLGDILNGVAPIALLVDLLTDDAEVPTAEMLVSMPLDNSDYDEMLLTADAIMDDIPDTVATMGFWVALTDAFFPENSWFRLMFPLFMIIALCTWLMWKK